MNPKLKDIIIGALTGTVIGLLALFAVQNIQPEPLPKLPEINEQQLWQNTPCTRLPPLDWDKETPELHQRREECAQEQAEQQWQQEQTALAQNPPDYWFEGDPDMGAVAE